MSGVDTTLLVLAFTLGAAIGARHLRTPMPVVLAIVGIVAGACWHLVPGLPAVSVPPDRVLFAFLPPLLTTAAYALPLGAVRRNIVPIGALVVGLVLVTMAGTAAVAHLAAGLPWAVALVLGAIVAPPDPVAATSVATKMGLDERLIVILEGEGLMNDAVAIVCYQIAVAAAVTGTFGWDQPLLAVLREVPTGVIIGLVVGWSVAAIRRRLDDVPLEVGLSLLVPYVTYDIADRTGSSGVLAVVTLGFMLRRYEADIASPAARVAARTVWATVKFGSTSLVFVLVGLLVGEVAGMGFSSTVLWAGVWVTLAVIAIRLVWMHTVPHLLRLAGAEAGFLIPTGRELTVLGWAGMRGVVSLALALALPAMLDPSSRDTRPTTIYLTFAVIVGTLVGQGVLLLPLVHWLGVGDPARQHRAERRARARARWAGVAALEREARANPAVAARCDALARRVRDGSVGIAAVGAAGANSDAGGPLMAALSAQRMVVETMRDDGRIGEAVAARLVTEIDVDEMTMHGDAARLTDAESE